MMKGKSSSSDVKPRHPVCWVSVVWFTSAVAIAASQGVTLQTDSQVAGRCGENVTLTCDVSSSSELDVRLLSWLDKNNMIVCDGASRQDSEVVCERTIQPLVHTLSLTLLSVMPAHQGEYSCKLRSTFGAKSSTTNVTVQDCVGSHGSSLKGSHAECWFSGVYPIGTVHWFQGDVNFTHSASTQQEMDHQGRYNVSSTLDAKEGNPEQPYECSLRIYPQDEFIPSDGKLLASQVLPPVGKQEDGSSGSEVAAQWICVVLGIMAFMI